MIKKKKKKTSVKDLPELVLNFASAHERLQNFSVLEGKKIRRDMTIESKADI